MYIKLPINKHIVNILFMKTEQKNLFLWLMVFNEVVKQGSFTQAADSLRLTKSGVSQHVSRLESHLGVQLLIRSTRSLSLTNAGERLLRRAGELKTLLDITVDEMSGIKQQPSGTLSITAPQALVPGVVLPAIHQLVKRFPEIKPQLIVDDGNQDIVKKGIDIAIRVGKLEDSDLRARRIGGHTEIFVASSAYLASTEKPITISNIDTHPFIATSWQTTKHTHQLIDNNKVKHDLSLQPSYEVNSANTAIDLVKLDLGIALLPTVFVKTCIKEGKIQHVLRELETGVNDVYCLHAYKGNAPLKIKWFIKFLTTHL